MTGKHQVIRTGRSLPVVFGAVVALVLASATVVTASVASGPTRAAAAGSALACDQNTIYGIDSGGNLDALNVTTGAATLVKSVSPAFNGLGIAANGVTSYQYDGTDRKITKYDPVAGTVTTFSNVDAAAPTTIIRGAIDPANGIYYYAGSGTSAYMGAWNTTTDTAIGQVGTITGLQNLNGDFAFSSQGLLFVVSGNQILRVNDTTPPTTAGNETLATTVIATLPAGTNSPGHRVLSRRLSLHLQRRHADQARPRVRAAGRLDHHAVGRLHPDRPRELQLPQHDHGPEERRRTGRLD